MMSEKCEAFPKQTGVLQKHNFNNKLDIFLTLFLAKKGIYKYNDKESDDLLNEKESIIFALKEENEQLRKQIQNYEQLISNSYVGEEETLDGFVGKYVIWENELQKYKNKNEMIGDE